VRFGKGRFAFLRLIRIKVQGEKSDGMNDTVSMEDRGRSEAILKNVTAIGAGFSVSSRGIEVQKMSTMPEF
jgi:hypothetical protein